MMTPGVDLKLAVYNGPNDRVCVFARHTVPTWARKVGCPTGWYRYQVWSSLFPVLEVRLYGGNER